MKKYLLTEQYFDDETGTFLHWIHLDVTLGQWSQLRERMKEASNSSLILLVRLKEINGYEIQEKLKDYAETEILERLNK